MGKMTCSAKRARNWQIDRTFVLMTNWSPGDCLPLPRHYIRVHVYDHNIQTSSLRLLGQSKPNFMWSMVRKGIENLYILSGSHDQDGRQGYK